MRAVLGSIGAKMGGNADNSLWDLEINSVWLFHNCFKLVPTGSKMNRFCLGPPFGDFWENRKFYFEKNTFLGVFVPEKQGSVVSFRDFPHFSLITSNLKKMGLNLQRGSGMRVGSFDDAFCRLLGEFLSSVRECHGEESTAF